MTFQISKIKFEQISQLFRGRRWWSLSALFRGVELFDRGELYRYKYLRLLKLLLCKLGLNLVGGGLSERLCNWSELVRLDLWLNFWSKGFFFDKRLGFFNMNSAFYFDSFWLSIFITQCLE